MHLFQSEGKCKANDTKVIFCAYTHYSRSKALSQSVC